MKTRKAFILFFIIIITISFSSVYATEGKYIFPEDEVLVKITADKASRNLTVKDMNSLIDDSIKKINNMKKDTYAANLKHIHNTSEDLVTVRMFLDEFINSFNGNFIKKVNNEYVYVAGDSMWMSKEEWKNLTSNLDGNMTYGDARLILKRTESIHEFMKKHKVPYTSEDYKEIVHSLFPIFSEFIKYDENSINEWFDLMQEKKGNVTIWKHDNFSNIIHEMQHEIAAKESGAYLSHGLNKEKKYSVSWTHLPQKLWCYNPLKEKWVTINTLRLPTGDIMNDDVSEEVKNIDLYNQYVSNKNSAVNAYAIYGMLTELISYSLELRLYAIDESYDYMYSYVSGHYVETTNFMMNSIVQYLVSLKENDYSLYKKLMSDVNLLSLIYDVHLFVDESIDLIDTVRGKEVNIGFLEMWKKNIIKDFLSIESIPGGVFQYLGKIETQSS